jgi:hypothetical protein
MSNEIHIEQSCIHLGCRRVVIPLFALFFDSRVERLCRSLARGGMSAGVRLTYLLYDYFTEHGLFLIHVGYGESQAWYLVNQVDGKEQEIIAPPRYFPNKKWLASVYPTDGGDDGNNGIDIFPADLDPAKPRFHYRPKEYEQWEFAGWNGDDRLLVKVAGRVGNNPELVTWPAEVVHVNGEWQLKKMSPTSQRP